MRINPRSFLSLTCAVLILAAPVLADVPSEVTVQGRLTDSTGTPIETIAISFTFRIFDAEVGGSEAWPGGGGEIHTLATDANGLWTARLGSIIPLTETVFTGINRWLEVVVDDAVDQPDTLSRIKLNTNPYTYRSASSQQADVANNADLLDGLTSAAFADTAHTHTGLAANGWIDDGTVVRLETPTDSVAIGVVDPSEVLDVAGNIHASGTITSGSSIAIDGVAGTITSSSGIQIVAPTGDMGLQLPVDVISAPEIIDEPGIVRNVQTFGPSFLVSTMTDLVTLSITIPTSGYILLTGRIGRLDLSGTTGALFVWLQIDETAGGPIIAYQYALSGALSYVSTADHYFSPSVDRVYFKSAGTYTFRLEAAKGGSGTAEAHFETLNAVFIPTSYGSVVTSVTSGELGQFENFTTTLTSSIATEGAAIETYLVDLRELELKVARAEAEAEKAKRELLEAPSQIDRPGMLNPEIGDQKGDQ